jgi:hypothetical protein
LAVFLYDGATLPDHTLVESTIILSTYQEQKGYTRTELTAFNV